MRKRRIASQLQRLRMSHEQFKHTASTQLATFEEQLYNQFQSQQFYSHAVLALAQEGDEVDLWIIGALVFERQLRTESEALMQQLNVIRTSISMR